MKRNLLCRKEARENSTFCRKLLILSAFFLASVSLPEALHAQSPQRISFQMRQATIEQAIGRIKETTRYRFSYRVEDLPSTPRRDYSFNNASIDAVMSEVLKGTSLEWTESGGTIVISPGPRRADRPAGNVTLKGTVREADGQPCIGASVTIKGTTRGVSTDADGRFSITVPRTPDMVVVFSYLGLKTQEVPYTGQSDFLITMEPDSQHIEDIVVTGIFDRPKEGFSGSSTTLGADQIKSLSQNNVLTALAIMDPSFKMNVSNISGSNPTAIPDYQMRGQATIDGSYTTDDAAVLRGDYNSRPNQPLFVLDGIIDVGVTTIMDLDPEQVESITLLKDAAATVIYGSQAANGVVVVETRKPERGKLRITYNGNYGLALPDLKDYDLVNSYEKMLIEEAAGFFRPNELLYHQEHTYIQHQVAKGVNTEWISKPVRNAFTHRHGINFEGGDDTFRYKVYLGANFQPGVMKNTDMNTQSGRIDLQYRMGKFMIYNQTYLNYGKGRRESDYGSFELYASQNPYYTPYDENGNLKKVLSQGDELASYKTVYNPIWNTTLNSRNEVRDFDVKEALKLEYNPVKNLRLTLDFTVSRRTEVLEVFKSANHTTMAYEADPERRGNYDKKNLEESDYSLALTAAYNKTFRNDHLLSLYGRFNIQEKQSNQTMLTMTGFPNDKLSEIFMGTTFKNIDGDENISRNMGFVFTGNYLYKSRYAADVSLRIDGSSQFGRNQRFAPFWSAGLRWNIHNEPLFQRIGTFDMLVLRASVGTTGSNSFNSYQALQMYSYAKLMSTYVSSPVVGAELQGMGNPDLKWQQTENYNAAFEFGMLDNRIEGRFEYYYKYTKNALLDFTLAPSVGFSSIKENLGSISNRGYEFSLRVTPYRNESRQAYWNIMVTAAHNKSKIEEISDALKSRNEEIYKGDETDLTRPMPQYVNGQSMTAIWGMRSLGIDPQTGLELFYTRDGKQTAKWNANNVVVIGDKEPKLAGSISTQFGYKNFSLTVAATFTHGGYLYNRTLVDKVENADLTMNVDRRVLYDRWKEPGDVVKFKRIQQGAVTNATSRFVMKNNEFNLSTINMSYRFNRQDHRFMRTIGLSNATVGLYFTDILRLSSIKMERGIDYPFAHQISMSLNLSF